MSTDEGRTFPHERLVASGPAAYSDLEQLPGGRLALLWERDNYGFITFVALDSAFVPV